MIPNSVVLYENEITRIIVDWDPMGLKKYDKNEYQSVLDEIFEKTTQNTTLNSLTKIIEKSFKDNYGTYFKKNSDCFCVAEKIYKVIHNQKNYR